MSGITCLSENAESLSGVDPSVSGLHETKEDVIGFLSYLAVVKEVSASSQNQAFNALLFLFKQVLKKEFGELKIPVVLSRQEIDLK